MASKLERLKERLKDLGRKITGWTRRVAAAQGNVQSLTKRIDHLTERLEDATQRSDEARRLGDYDKARKLDKKALSLSTRLGGLQGRRRFWIGRIKQLRAEKRGFAETQRQVEVEIDKLVKERLVFDVDENRVTGGTQGQRFRGAALLSSKRCLTGKRTNFYSQPGTWSIDRCFTGEPFGYRSDCSQWLTSVCWTAGIPDPNGTAWAWGYTGTLVAGNNGWRQVDEATMRKKGWGFVVYGSGVGFHVEAYVGPGDRTIGHGSAPIDPGVINLLGDGNYRCFIYDPNN